MCGRLEAKLVDVPTCGMACGTERLLVVTGLALRCLTCSRDRVSKPEVEVVHLRQPHSSAAIVCCESRASGRDQIPCRDVNLYQISTIVTIDAGLLRMA